MSGKRTRAAHAIARGVAAVVTVLVGGAMVGAAVISGGAVITRTAPVLVADPPLTATSLVCPDTFLVLGRDVNDAQRIGAAGTFTETSNAAAAGADPLSLPLADGSVQPSTVITTQVGGSADAAAATGTVRLTDEDASGFAVAACRPALTETWLVGVDTSVGATGVIVLSNPGEVTATVSLTVYGATGPQTPPGAAAIVVPARSSAAIAVAAIAGTESNPVVAVRATGAPVQASIQSSLVRGLTPAGIDVQQAGATAAATQVMPGVVVQQVVNGVKASQVRLLAPEADGTATVAVYRSGSAQTESLAGGQVPLTAGIPFDLPLDGLTPGSYDVVVTADVDVVAATWQITGVSSSDDIAWFPAVPPISAATTAVVGDGVAATLTVRNTSAVEASVEVTSAGAAKTLTVPAGGSVQTAVGVGDVRLAPAGGATVEASITYAATGSLASQPLWPGTADVAQVSVTR